MREDLALEAPDLLLAEIILRPLALRRAPLLVGTVLVVARLLHFSLLLRHLSR